MFHNLSSIVSLGREILQCMTGGGGGGYFADQYVETSADTKLTQRPPHPKKTTLCRGGASKSSKLPTLEERDAVFLVSL